MISQTIAIALAISGAYASPVMKRDECSDACSAAYNTCRGQSNVNRSTCASEYSSCLGYLPFDNSGSLVTPTACSITTSATPTPTATKDACAERCSVAYNTCRGRPDANRATCAAEYSSCLGFAPFDNSGSLVTPTACSITISAPTATFTSISGIPGGCNPAHPGSCQSSYFTHLTVTHTAAATQAPTATGSSAPATGAGWTVKDLTRYCSEDGTGCDYNFIISTNDGRADERCTVVRTDVGDALTESWYDQPCTTGSANTVSWGYSAQFDVPFAVLTVVNQQEKAVAYFGVSDVNGQPVTASNPKGSGNFGDIGPQPVSTF